MKNHQDPEEPKTSNWKAKAEFAFIAVLLLISVIFLLEQMVPFLDMMWSHLTQPSRWS